MSKDEKLQEYFDFTESDLQENRLGSVSEDQKILLKEKAWKEAARIAVVFAALGIIVFVVFLFRFPSSGSSSSSLMYPGILVAVAIVSIVFRSLKKSDLSLHSVQGRVEFIWEERRVRDSDSSHNYTTVRTLKMNVGDKSFDAREELMDIIDQGDKVRFYYTGGGDIVSAEFTGKS